MGEGGEVPLTETAVGDFIGFPEENGGGRVFR